MQKKTFGEIWIKKKRDVTKVTVAQPHKISGKENNPKCQLDLDVI